MVSVIIPAYNCAKYLKRCICSILNQSYNDIECIIVDDGSTDKETSQLCDAIKKEDKRVIVIHKLNEGAEKAREVGFNISNGHYIMYVDADDYLENDIISKCVVNIEESEADIVCFNYCMNEEGKSGFQIHEFEVLNQREALKEMLTMSKLDGNMWCKLYRRSVLEGICFDIRRNCDFVTVFHILEKTEKIILLPTIGYHYSLIEGSQSRNNTCHPREEEYVNAAYELYILYKDDFQISAEAEYYWLCTLLYVCIKMEKDREIQRKSERFCKVKTVLRRNFIRYYRNPYSKMQGRLQFLLCYLDLFRSIYRLYSLIRQ